MTPAERLAVELGARVGEVDGRKIVPMLCGRDETGERVLGHHGWIFELKLDGVRIVADKRGGEVSLAYRKLRDATSSYPEIAEAIAKLAEERLVLDGEIVAFDDEGRPNFQRLGTRIQRQGADARRASAAVPVVYVVFDVLAIGDRDVTQLPIEARKAILERVLADTSALNGLVRLHPTFADGESLFRLCREQGLEGVVAKRNGSVYQPDERSTQWVKVKCELDADLVVVGWTAGEGTRSRLGALDVAVYDGGRFVLRGRVGSGLDDATIDVLLPRLRALEVPRSMAEGKPRPKKERHHVRPEIVVSVRYMGVSDDGLLRFPVFRGLRPDLSPEDCTLEGIAGSTTKDALCSYYEVVAPLMVPYLRDRVCTLVPRGQEEPRRVVIEDAAGLCALVEEGASSFRMSATCEGTPGTADFIALHLEGAGAARLALRARDLVAETGLTAYAKLAGAGIDVLVAIGDAPAEAAHALGQLLARLLHDDAQALSATIARSDAPVAPYGVIAPSGAGASVTASLPLAWEVLEADAAMRLPWASASLDSIVAANAAGALDPLRGMLDRHVDFPHAVEAIERMVAESTRRTR